MSRLRNLELLAQFEWLHVWHTFPFLLLSSAAAPHDLHAVLGIVIGDLHLGRLKLEFAAVTAGAVTVRRVADVFGTGLAGEGANDTGDLSHFRL